MIEAAVSSPIRSLAGILTPAVGMQGGAPGDHAISAVSARAARATLMPPRRDFDAVSPGLAENRASATAIPKKLHFVWLGGNISAQDMSNISLDADLNPDYEVNIWTDRPMSICATRTAILDDVENPLHQHPGGRAEKGFFASADADGKPRIRIRDVASVFSALRTSMPSEDRNSEGQPLPGPGARLESLFLRELNGHYRNYAAASDIARMAILFEEGGVYLDVDVIPKEPLGDLHSPIGFMFLTLPRGTHTSFNNNVMAAARRSAPAAWALRNIVEAYSDYDKETLGSWTIKRTNEAHPDGGRFQDTLELSGPELLGRMEDVFHPRHRDLFRGASFGSRAACDENNNAEVSDRNARRQSQGLPPSIKPRSVEEAKGHLRSLAAAPLPPRLKYLMMDWTLEPDNRGSWSAQPKPLRRARLTG